MKSRNAEIATFDISRTAREAGRRARTRRQRVRRHGEQRAQPQQPGARADGRATVTLASLIDDIRTAPRWRAGGIRQCVVHPRRPRLARRHARPADRRRSRRRRPSALTPANDTPSNERIHDDFCGVDGVADAPPSRDDLTTRTPVSAPCGIDAEQQLDHAAPVAVRTPRVHADAAAQRDAEQIVSGGSRRTAQARRARVAGDVGDRSQRPALPARSRESGRASSHRRRPVRPPTAAPSILSRSAVVSDAHAASGAACRATARSISGAAALRRAPYRERHAVRVRRRGAGSANSVTPMSTP